MAVVLACCAKAQGMSVAASPATNPESTVLRGILRPRDTGVTFKFIVIGIASTRKCT